MPLLAYLSALLKPKARKSVNMASSHHLMMRGIYDKVFLGQWGRPEIKISINDLEPFYVLDILRKNIDIQQNIVAWIYERKDMVLFFKGEKLISHFKWSLFKKSFGKSHQKGFSSFGASVGTLRGNKTPLNLEGGWAYG